MRKKDILIAFLGFGISFILIYSTFKNFDFEIVFPVIKKLKIGFLFTFFISTFLEIIFRTLKWYFIILPLKKVDFLKLFKFEVISLGINNILPFRMGEVAKMFLLSKNYSLSKTTSLSTVFVERLLDTFILVGLFLIYSYIGNINLGVNKNFIILILLLVSITVFVFFIYIEKILNSSSFSNISVKHPKIYDLIIKIKNGGLCFKKTYILFLTILSGVVQWNFDFLNNFFIAKSMDINLNYFKSAATVFAGSLSASIPSMPGYFGNYEYAISRVMILWQFDKNISVLFPTIIHLLTYILITSSALVFIYMEKESLRNIFYKLRKE